MQNIGLSGDTRKSFALAFAGTNLWETNNGVGVIPNAAAIGSQQIHSSNVFPMAGAIAITSDRNGLVYVGTTNSILVFDGIRGSSPATLASGFAFVGGLAVDDASVTSPGRPAGSSPGTTRATGSPPWPDGSGSSPRNRPPGRRGADSGFGPPQDRTAAAEATPEPPGNQPATQSR